MGLGDLLYGLALTANINFGGGLPVEWSVDVTPTFYADVDLPEGTTAGFTLPYLMLMDEDALREDIELAHQQGLGFSYHGDEPYTLRSVRQHEYTHARQWEALGPAFLALYAGTGGRAFENYNHSTGELWSPPEGMRNYPMLRFGSDKGVEFLPGWLY